MKTRILSALIALVSLVAFAAAPPTPGGNVGVAIDPSNNVAFLNVTAGGALVTQAGGDVVGPSSSTDNAVARFDGTTGKLLQNSLVTIGDTGDSVFPGLLTLSSTSGTSAGGFLIRDSSLFANATEELTFGSTNGVRLNLKHGTTVGGDIIANTANQFLIHGKNGHAIYLYTDDNDVYVQAGGAKSVFFKTNGTTALTLDSSQKANFAGDALPSTNYGASLGSTAKQWNLVYADGIRAVYFNRAAGMIFNSGETTTGVTDLTINPTTKESGNLIDAQVNGTSKFSVTSAGAATFSGTISTTGGGAVVASGAIYANGALFASYGTRSGPGAINLSFCGAEVTTTGVADAITLADGTAGQVMTIVHGVDGGSFVLTPATKTGWSTFTSTVVGESITVKFYTTRGWMVVSSYLGVIAP